ncbi:MAG: ABC transporter permease subunit [Ignavibacteriales bacterium]|nr:ABC transporter permease subunit [Ignavibacteriales bacterium]
MNKTLKIIKYQIKDNIQSRWIIGFFIFFMTFTYWLINFTGDAPKVILSILNMILIVIPLISLMFGSIYIYNNLNYIKFMLTQPIKRISLYFGLYFGLAIPLLFCLTFGIGIGVLTFFPLFEEYLSIVILLLITGLFQILIFTAIAFLIATSNDDTLKGLGISIFVWLFFTIIYDGLILFILQTFQDYPLERIALGLTMINPIDLGRIFIILKFDVSALMGYTGAVFEDFFGNNVGLIISLSVQTIWFLISFIFGLKIFKGKDF